LYADLPAGGRGRDAAVIVVDLTAVALAALVLLLVAYLRPGNRSNDRNETAGTVPDERTGGSASTRAKDSDAGLATLPARDLDDALRITGGSLDIAESLLEQMLAELPAQIETLTSAAAGSDWAGARRAAEGIKGAVAACAVPALSAAVCRLEAATRNADAGAIGPMLADVEHERRRLISAGRSPGLVSTLAQASAR
jgi:HPt (histidine-containing phosphotransfer) domain-containing protein